MHDGLEPSTYADTPGAATRASTEMSPQTATLAASIADNDMSGRVCVVTGASRGLGKATALGLARLGATVVLLARDERLLSAARDEVAAESGNPHVSTIVADLASFAEIRTGAQELSARHEALHVLVHNAGVNPTKRKLSADGIELTLAVNHLAPFLLTRELLPALRRGAPERGARVVTVVSMFERFGFIAFDDVQWARHWIGPLAYAQSKLANVLFTYELAERLAGTGITANCVDPGLVATDLMREHVLFRPRWLKAMWGRVLASPAAGARAAVHAASAPEIATVTGKCFDRYGREVRTSRQSRNPQTRARLWALSEKLTGVPFSTT
jgi:NAD(P)-dependent dehydrogenase (short-subunit alcohol dehydrogenase family)